MTIHCYNFKPQFVAPIQAGTKIHTIRACRKDGRVPKPGDTLKLFTGLRQKGPATVILEAPCVSVTPIELWAGGNGTWLCVRLGGVEVIETRKVRLAFNDGFSSFGEFQSYFMSSGLPLIGHLIAWRQVKY